jgi:hypothetical protein
MPDDIFSAVEKQVDSGTSTKASWRGILSLNIPTLGLGAMQYHLRAGKAHGDLQPVKFIKIDKETGKEVVPREVVRLYKYRLGPKGERLDYDEISYDDTKAKVRYDSKFFVSARTEKRFFLKD